MSTQDVTHFTSIDHTADPAFFLRFLDEANKQAGAIAWKPFIVQGLRLQQGMRVLDVDCGMGFEIAPLIAPGGSVTRVDLSES